MEGCHNSPARRQWQKYLIRAVKEMPEGIICVFCGGLNTNVDDCGFFHLSPNGPSGLN